MAGSPMSSPATPSTSPYGQGENVFPWTRFWVPSNKPISMVGVWDHSADFLSDPEDGLIGKHSNAHLKTTASLLAPKPGLVVLSGEPGMGKTQALRHYLRSQSQNPILALEFREIPDTAEFRRVTLDSDTWRTWRAGTGLLTVAIDGVDEGLIKISGFVDFLASLLRSEPVDRLQMILACRSLEWPAGEGQSLGLLWKGEPAGVHELCPLRDRDVREAAAAVLPASDRKSVDAFMRHVRRHQLIGLASRPLTLRMLLREHISGEQRSRTHRDLFRRYSKYLCTEPNAPRTARLKNRTGQSDFSPAVRHRLAARIAALFLLSGRSAIWPGNAEDAGPSDLTMEEICDGPDALEGVEFTVTPAMVEAVLATPLFWPKDRGRFGFYHQTFAECLAAEYLRELPFPQIRSLLCRRDQHGEFVHPPLAEAAAWLSGDSGSFLNHLIEHDPETLLRSDVSAVTDLQKARLVDAVLERAARAELFDARGLDRFLHTLVHPGIAGQLRPLLRDRKKNHVVRRLAFRIAEACKVTELFDDALARLRDPADSSIHSVAAASLDDLVDGKSASRLARFFVRRKKGSLGSSVELSVLHALLSSGYWDLRQAIPHFEGALTPASLDGHVLARHAKPSDVELLLRACLRWPGCFDSLNRYHPLAETAVDMAMNRIEEPEVRRLMVRVWWRAVKRHDDESIFSKRRDHGKPSFLTRLREDSELRHAVIDDLAGLAEVWSSERFLSAAGIARPEDFSRLLERSQVGSPQRRSVFARLSRQTFDPERHCAHWDALLEGLTRSKQLRDAFPWLRVWDLNSPEAAQEKKNFYEWQSRRESSSKKTQSKFEDPVSVWRSDLAYLASGKGKATDWMNIAHNLFYRGGGEKSEEEDKRDLTTSPGWKFHDDAARSTIVEGARRMLLKVPGNPHHPVGGNSAFDEMAYKALYLLRDEIEKFPALAKAVRRYWLPIIFDEFSDQDEHHLQMMAIAYRLDPAAMRSLIEAKILRDQGRDQGLTLELREFSRCWDSALADFVVQLCVGKIDNPTTIRCIMEYLAEHDSSAAIHLWRRLQASAVQQRPRFVAATAALATARLFEHWDEIWPLLQKDSALAQETLLALDGFSQRKFLEPPQPVTVDRLADLYLSLRKLFPPDEDLPTPKGKSVTMTHRRSIARLRDEIPTILAAFGTEEAADQLLRISKSLPSDDALWIRWKWRDAVTAARRKAWTPPAPAVVLELVRRASSRYLTDESDLLEVVIESLQRLEKHLTATPNSQRIDYWQVRDGPGKKQYFKPDSEVGISRRITSWLQTDLVGKHAITIQREVQVQWDNRTDIEVRAVAVAGTLLRPLEIVIEVKGCWHPKVRSAHADQLVADYLKRTGWTHGLYLVVWTMCPKWNDPKMAPKSHLKAKTLDVARAELADLVREYDGKKQPFFVRSVVLDARL